MSARPLSPFERLPLDLFCKLFELYPESVYLLRLTSKSIISAVSDYSMRSIHIPIAEVLRFTGIAQDDTSDAVSLRWEVSPRFIRQFEQRIVFRQPPPGFLVLFSSFRTANPGNRHDNKYYCIDFHPSFLDVSMLSYLGECFGASINMVSITKCDEQSQMRCVNVTLEGIAFRKLEVETSELSASTENFLRNVASHNVEELSLTVGRVTINNPVDLLLNLASNVRAICIDQQVVDGIARNSNYFFGVEGAHWEEIITDMFLRRMDKLHLFNGHYLGYLQKANDLKDILPELGKSICFEAPCVNAVCNIMKGDHHVRVRDYFTVLSFIKRDLGDGMYLSIVHKTRKNEPFWSE